MEKPWIDAEELRWLQSLEMPAVRETARQDGIRETIRAQRKATLEEFNLDWIIYLHVKGEKLSAIHYVLDLPEYEVRKVLEKLDDLIAKWPQIRPVLSLIIRLHQKGRSAEEICKSLDLPLGQVHSVLSELGKQI